MKYKDLVANVYVVRVYSEKVFVSDVSNGKLSRRKYLIIKFFI